MDFWQDLCEDQQQKRHHAGGVKNAAISKKVRHQACGEGRPANVGNRIAQQHGTNETRAIIDQFVGGAGARVAVFLKPVEPRPRRSRERRLRAGEKCRQDNANDDNRNCNPEIDMWRRRPFHGQCPASSSSRKPRTCATSTPRAIKLWPMPRARMKVSAPRCTFLS